MAYHERGEKRGAMPMMGKQPKGEMCSKCKGSAMGGKCRGCQKTMGRCTC